MNENDLIQLVLTNTLGESVLVETLKSAAYFVMHSANFQTKRYETKNNFLEARYCYFFVTQGTGLERLIQRFHLGYDPDALRSNFQYYLRHS